MPVAAILALVELIESSTAGTTFELVQALTDGAEQLKNRTPNSISLSAGVELFVAFVTLFPHESDVCRHHSQRVLHVLTVPLAPRVLMISRPNSFPRAGSMQKRHRRIAQK